MNTGVIFAACLALTVALLSLVVWTGLRARRRLHIPLVGVLVVSLTVTIIFAERLGRGYDLESAGWITPVHLTLAKITTLAFLLPVITGVRTLKHPLRRGTHRKLVGLVLVLTALTFATGVWMILAATPLPAPN